MKRALLYIIMLMSALTINASEEKSIIEEMDSVEMCLLTCEPQEVIWGLYGHTALRVHDKREGGYDFAVNYGIFDKTKSMFILRFTFGLTDYMMDIEPFEYFCMRYASYGSGVKEQVLNLTSKEKAQLWLALMENYKPENRSYRYNYFYDNCTTRIRDILSNNIDGEIVFPTRQDSDVSFRQMIHQWNRDHLWAAMGNDLLLGVKADMPTSVSDQQFLPDSMRMDFAYADIINNYEIRRPLVLETRYPVPLQFKKDRGLSTMEKFTSPSYVGYYLLLIAIIVSLIEIKTKKYPWWFDAIVLSVSGIAGIILTAMIFSQHPTVSLNLQILILNPFNIILLVPVIKKGMKNQRHKYWLYMMVLSTVALIISFTLQDFADGIRSLALILMLRSYIEGIYKPKF